MPDILNTSLTGLAAFQQALATTSHNVANVNTEGYSRQRVEFGTMPPTNVGVGYIGRGVQPKGIVRILDQFRVDQLRANVSEQARLSALNDLASGIDGLLSSPESGLSQPLSDFFAALQAVADDPASVPIRQVALGQAEALADRFRTLSGRLEQQSAEVDARLSTAVDQVNALTASIAELNGAVAAAEAAAGGAPPNDLLDQRDVALKELAGLIAVDVLPQDDGTVSVFAAGGQALVLTTTASRLVLAAGDYLTADPDIRLQGANGVDLKLKDLSGGEIGGLLDYRREFLNPSINALGQLAVGLADSLNAQSRLGMDLDGNLGGDFFTVAGPVVAPAIANSGAATVTAQVSDVGGLTGTDYRLAFDGSVWSLTRTDTGTAVSLTGSGSPADPFLADGLSIGVSGAAAAGDSFLVQPTAPAAGGVALAIGDPRAIPAALPIAGAAAVGNGGSGRIGGGTVLDPADPNLLAPVDITFLDPNTYQINGAGSFAYTDGAPIALNGWQVTISGAPVAGDTFTVSSNAGGVGDNRNAQALTSALDARVLNGGTASVRDRFESLVAEVATETRRTATSLTAQTAITARAETDHQAVSGVNLDEEAANMLRYQQAYQAMAQMVNVADVLFQTLLSVARN